ncbi:uncharacterized protein LOC144611996 isoform X3 [Rhinoraja longicauda]
MMEEVGNRDQDVPASPFSDTSEKMLSSQDADFTVPSTPVDLNLQDMISATDQTLDRNPSPQVPGVSLDPEPTAIEGELVPLNNFKQKNAA